MTETAIEPQEIVRLREKEGLGWHEIGNRLGLSGEATRSRYRHFKKRESLKGDPGILEAAADLGIGDTLKLKGGWLKSKGASLRFEAPNPISDDDALEEYAEKLKMMLAGTPRARPTPAPDSPDDIRARYLVADLHGGMAANMLVSGEDYDLDIATDRLREATTRLVTATHPTHTAIVANLGDMFHANDSKKQTYHSGHILDMVTESFPTIALRVTEAMIEMIEILKERHDRVIYMGVPGNHDVDQFFWLTIALMMRFRDDPRVEIQWHQSKLIVEQFGRNMFVAHHGDRVTFQQLVNQAADQYAHIWGDTRHRYLDTGHTHSDTAKEVGGMYCESHRNLAPVDAAAHGFGFLGRQTAKAIVCHRERGEITRNTVSFN